MTVNDKNQAMDHADNNQLLDEADQIIFDKAYSQVMTQLSLGHASINSERLAGLDAMLTEFDKQMNPDNFEQVIVSVTFGTKTISVNFDHADIYGILDQAIRDCYSAIKNDLDYTHEQLFG